MDNLACDEISYACFLLKKVNLLIILKQGFEKS